MTTLRKFRVNFRVEQTLSGSVEIEAASVEDAKAKFFADENEEARQDAKLDLQASQDSIVEIIDDKGALVFSETEAA